MDKKINDKKIYISNDRYLINKLPHLPIKRIDSDTYYQPITDKEKYPKFWGYK